MNMKVKKNDNVLVITGKYAGQKGKVISTSPIKHTLIVEGINIHTKAQKARRNNEVSQLVKKEAPIDASNVMVLCPSCDKAIRVKHNIVDGKKVRVCGKCGATLDVAVSSKKAAKKEAPAKRIRKRAQRAENKAQQNEN